MLSYITCIVDSNDLHSGVTIIWHYCYWDFKHKTWSVRYPKLKGLVEETIQKVKKVI